MPSWFTSVNGPKGDQWFTTPRQRVGVSAREGSGSCERPSHPTHPCRPIPVSLSTLQGQSTPFLDTEPVDHHGLGRILK